MKSNRSIQDIGFVMMGAVGISMLGLQAAPAQAAEKAANKPAGKYVTGDFHNHTTCTDGTISLKKLVDKSTNTFNLDWFVQSEHGGNGARNCTLAEDPFEPVAPALGLAVPPTYPSGGQPVASGKGPNQTWTATIGNAAIKGDVSGTDAQRNMWRWQNIKEYSYPVLEKESRDRNKPIWIGLEQNAPGHEHVSSTILDGQLPATGSGNATAMAQFEYCFDRSDTDKSRGAENQWDCAVPGSANNGLLDAAARKILVASGTGSGTAGHVKSVEGVKWMGAKFGSTSYYVPAHLERAGAFNPNGNNGFNIESLRDFNNAAPTVAFGFESMPGHQAEHDRGSYSTNAVGGGTYGGTGVYAAAVGGVWDALLGEGRNWFFFASSDYHNRGSFGPDQRESTADFFPGEYTRDHVMVRSGANKITPQLIVDGLRSGNSFVANGQLIDRLSFVVCAAHPGIVRRAQQGALEAASANAAAKNADVAINGCATMGEKLVVRPGTDLIVSVVLRDPPGTSNSPYGFANPSLKQVGITQPLNAPVLDHVDVIRGNVTGYVAPTDTAKYAGTIDTAAAKNPSAAVIKTFNATNWTASGDGTRRMSFRIPAVAVSQYVRLRGTNLPVATPYETDAAGNPLLDFGAEFKIPCTDAACPAHLQVNNGQKTSSYDVAAWADLWFYSNPVFVEVAKSVKIAGIK
jgi:hypothetical protein